MHRLGGRNAALACPVAISFRMKTLRFLLLLVVLGTLGAMAVVFRPAAQEVGDTDSDTVSDSELQMYIKVYEAMQDDHDLTVEQAITPHHLTLDEFRHIERRIQNQPRLVDRVREALLENARAHSVFAESVSTPTPIPAPTEPQPRPRKKH